MCGVGKHGPTVLVVDDDADAREVIATRLRHWGYEVESAASAEEALQVLSTPPCPKIAIVDWMMPGMSGLELVQEIRRRTDEYIYVLMRTRRTQRSDLLAALEAGVDDYLAKPCHTPELQLRLRAGMRVVELQDRLRQLADHDALTGCWNRRRLLRFLRDELARGLRNERGGRSVDGGRRQIQADQRHVRACRRRRRAA